ncbi:S-layer homology domain-containing protein [Paenibacillus filicis]|uniref:S-layer homology domain-containing protein n=1 Tax=Paenibacillus filicis TaxID=669464 RepID=A0ABU9DNH5_9BACL
MSITASLFAQSLAAAAAAGPDTGANQPAPGGGRWVTGEYHAHTFQSDDAQQSLEDVLDKASQYGMDWIALSDHLRMSARDDEGHNIPGGPIPFSQGIIQYQAPKIKQLQAAGKYAGKIMFSGFEWDMPTYEHVGIGILTDHPNSDEALKVSNQFEYLFSDRPENKFDPSDVAAWKAKDNRAFSTKEDARTGLKWLQTNYPSTSYAILNHPSRKTVYTIADIRDFNNVAPDVVFGLEGMPGNQMEPDRGGLNLSTPKNRTYGGSDYMIAKLGGTWDALLGEGRRFWNFANSDSHFEISSNRLYSSGYWPGEYSKNYTWVNGNDMQAVLDGMKSGKSFSVFGDLINKLDFTVAGGGSQQEMGGNLQVNEGDKLQLTIRFKSPETNNNGDPVQVDHVDLISGDVTGKAIPGTAAYSKDTNDSTKVVKRFTSQDWTTEADGTHVITYEVGRADKNKYFRLRGTNLGTDVEGETINGEPLMDEKTDIADNELRFAEINQRNYKDLWFYSNPIFVDVKPNCSDSSQLRICGTLKTADGELYPQAAWTKQNVTASVYTAAQEPGSTVTLQVSRDGGDFLPYESGSSLELVQEGTHVLRFQASDSLGHEAVLPLKVNMDRTAPVITLRGAVSVTVAVYSPYTDMGADATDNLALAGPVVVTGSVDTSKLGTYQIHYKASDLAGNTAEAVRAVQVVAAASDDRPSDGNSGSTPSPGNSGNSDKEPDSGKHDKTTSVKFDAAGKQAAEGGIQNVLSFKIPANALSQDSVIQAEILQAGQAPQAGSYQALSPVVEMTSTGGRLFNKPVEITLNYKPDGAPAGSQAAVYYYNDTQHRWIYLGGSVDSAKGAVTVRVNHFTKFAVFAYKPMTFADLDKHWAKPYSDRLVGMRIVEGFEDGMFHPEEAVTRAQFAKMIADAFALPQAAKTTGFADDAVIPAWAKASIAAAVQADFIQGYEEQGRTVFKADRTITRAEMAVILSRVLGRNNGPSASGKNAFQDTADIPAWALSSVDAAVSSGILSGYEDQTFRPSGLATRAEATVVIYKLLESLHL